MELTWISLDKIKPNDYNPNVMSNDKFQRNPSYRRNRQRHR